MSNSVYQTVILGGGFTGLFTALHLAHSHYPRSVILIDQNDRFCFKPLLYEYFSGQMEAPQVIPRFSELLCDSGIIFVQDTVEAVDLQNQKVNLVSGNSYQYSNLVLALGSVTGYFGTEGAQVHTLPFRTQQDAIAIDRHLRDCLQRALQIADPQQRLQLLTVAVVGGGPSGVEMAATLADFLPHWYGALRGNPQEIRVVLLNHGQEILKGDINDPLRSIAETQLQKRAVPVEILAGVEVTAVRPHAVEYQRGDRTETLPTATTIWTAGTATHPVIKDLAIPPDRKDKHGRLQVTKTLQLPDFPEVFAGGDCAVVAGSSFPPTAQVAYQQAATIARNLKAIALGGELQPVEVNIRGTLLKLGLNSAAANLFNTLELEGETAHLIRQATYLTLLPTPIHDLKATAQWLREEIFQQYLHNQNVGKKVVQAAEVVSAGVVGLLVARRLLKMLGDDDKNQKT